MSVQSQIDRINENVANTYNALEGVGADMPNIRNTENLPETVVSIKAVRYDEQALTKEQQAQARKNIGIYDQIISNASGETIVLTDSTNNKLEGLTLYGKTTQNGTPTPEAPVELVSAGDDGFVDVRVYGKNIFNEAILLNANGWKYENGFLTGLNIYLRIHFNDNPLDIFKPNTQYYFSFWGYSADYSKNSRLTIEYTDGTHTDVRGLRNTELTFCECVTDKGKSVDRITIGYGEPCIIHIKNFMICESQSATEYEPYKKPQTLPVSTPNGLSGIPVTSGGNYTDKNGQQWICDEVDFSRGVYVQRVGRIDSYNGESIPGVYMSSTGSLTIGATVIYELTTPIETSLSVEQFVSYASMRTKYPTTTILNDGNAGMDVSYVASTKNYIDNQVAAMYAAILNL